MKTIRNLLSLVYHLQRINNGIWALFASLSIGLRSESTSLCEDDFADGLFYGCVRPLLEYTCGTFHQFDPFAR